MSERREFIEDHDNGVREEVFSHQIRAGKRTYYFDVKATRREDHFVTITESKKRFNKDGRFFFEKHKIFLYKEDFEKFMEGLGVAIDYVNSMEPVEKSDPMLTDIVIEQSDQYTNVDFDDLQIGITTNEKTTND
jgi:hypothetical protein